MDAADVPELQIIPDDTWKAAQDRLNAIRGRMNGVGGGRRRRDIDSEHLLPGFARCAVCGDTPTITRPEDLEWSCHAKPVAAGAPA